MADNTIYLYLSINHMVGSSVLVKNEAKGHVLIYYVSKVFTKVEMKYVEIEK